MRDSGGIDILINTVGVNCHCAADGYKDEDMARLLETNYISGLRFARAFIPGMRARHGGSIVNISSIHSVMTQPTNMLYAGTKGAMNAAARAMALDCAADGIRVNTICPGVVMSDVMYDDLKKWTNGRSWSLSGLLTIASRFLPARWAILPTQRCSSLRIWARTSQGSIFW